MLEALAVVHPVACLRITTLGQWFQAAQKSAPGHAPMSSQSAVKMVEFFHQQGRPSPIPDSVALTGLALRAREVLEFLAKGFTYREIAQQLELTFHTVNGYIKSTYEKLHVRSRAQAVNKLLGRPLGAALSQ